YVDQSVIEFLQRIRPLFNSAETNVRIATSGDQSRSWEIIRQEIWPLFNDNICGFLLLDSSVLDNLRQIAPAILRSCTKLLLIHCWDLFPAFPADDDAGTSSGQALAKWLLTARGDGLPKVLNCAPYAANLTELIWSFVNASKSANFIIRLMRPPGPGSMPFTMNNNLSEQLTLRRVNNRWLLVRCPIGRDEDKWAKWETEAIQWKWDSQWNRIIINFNI
uniref:HET domain-containing protein n=1 Tax=Globodera pallida TaxID=36090 RepID=A0A183CNZ4_GLOPA